MHEYSHEKETAMNGQGTVQRFFSFWCETFQSVQCTWPPFSIVSGLKKVQNDHERRKVVTLNKQEGIGTFKPERSSALERIVENVDVHVSKTIESLYVNYKSLDYKKFCFQKLD